MTKKRTYLVRVYRRYEEEYCELEVEAETPFQAKMLALNEAKRDADTLFMPLGEPDFDVEDDPEIV